MEKITTAASVSAAWRGMSDEEQYTALQKMAWTVRRGGSKRGAEWIQTQDDAMNVAAEAWLRMGAALERNERADEPRPLNLILYSACAQAANTIARREKRYFSATQEYGFAMCFAIHMLGLNMEVLGLLLGMLRVDYLTYLAGSWLAIAPGMVCLVIAGNSLDLSSPVFWVFLAINTVLVVCSVVYTLRKLRAAKAKGEKQDG